MQILTSDLDSYVGLPFVERGRTREGVDCWGLVALFYHERFGLELPHYLDRYETTADRENLARVIAGELGPWRRVEPGSERRGDAVRMLCGGKPTHTGIVAGDDRILHTERMTGSVIDRYSSPRLRLRIAGFFRHESLA